MLMINYNKFLLICFLFFILLSSNLFSQQSIKTIRHSNHVIAKYGLFETEFVADSAYNNPYVEVSLSAHVTGPAGIAFDVDGYWAGGNSWRLRIMPTTVGHWTYITFSNDPHLDGLSGTYDCIPSARRGILMVNPDYPYTFKLSDGEPFLWMGETSWCLMSNAVPFNDGTFQQYISKRVQQKFNGIHFVLGTGGLPHGTQNPKNEGGNLWISQQPRRINPDFFNWMDKRFAYLDSMQMAVGFFMTWSQHFATFTQEEFERFERYLIARYAAFPLLYWVIAGEYDEAGTIEDYNYHGTVFQQRDPYGHLISNHPNHHDPKNLGTSRIFAGQEWFGFVLQQLPQYPVFVSPADVHKAVLIDRVYDIPVVNDEYGYEDRDYYGKIVTSDWVRKYAWSIFLGGGFFSYGHEKTIRKVDLTALETEGVSYLNHLYDFFNDLNWWEMNPDTEKVDNGFCLARPLPEYIVYLPDSRAVNVDLSQDSSLLNASWYNPKDGIYGDTLVIQGGDVESFASPYPGDAVFHIFPNTKPIIQVQPDSLFFQGKERGANPQDQAVTITNTGGGILNWSAAKQPDVPWLSLNPTSGSAGDKIAVSIDISDLAMGFYYDTVRISDPNAINNPVDVPVTLKVDSLEFITLLSPNGGERWEVNSLHEINWQSENTSGTVKIEYSTDKGSSWTAIDSIAQDNHHYSWTIPNSLSTTCLVKISDTDGVPFDQSDSVFTIAAPLSADFIGEPTTGHQPLTVHFTDQSTGLIDSCYWEFGDGATSTDQNPMHRYRSVGLFTVILTVTGPTGQDKETKLNYIKVFDKRSIVSGKVTYYNQGRQVSETVLNLTHAEGTSKDTTNENGSYYFEAIPNGNVKLVPLKKANQENFITGVDALLILQYSALLENLTEDQIFAADVNEDGVVNHRDAGAILNYLVFDNDHTGSTSQWCFKPDTSAFDLQADTTVDFKTFLLGDVNGDWQNFEESDRNNPGIGNEFDTSGAILKINELKVSGLNEIVVPIRVEQLEETLQTLVLTIDYDPLFLKFLSAQKTNLINKFMIAEYGNEPRKVHLAMAGVEGINKEGDISNLLFSVEPGSFEGEYTELEITRAWINDKRVVNIINGRLYFNDIEFVNTPDSFTVYQNQPNPFNQSTKICFDLPRDAKVELKIYNLLGQKITTLLKNTLPTGRHQITWNGIDGFGKPLKSGIYFYQVKVEENDPENGKSYTVMKKMFLLK